MDCTLDIQSSTARGGSQGINECEVFTVCLQMFVSGSLGKEEMAMGQKWAAFISKTKPGREEGKRKRGDRGRWPTQACVTEQSKRSKWVRKKKKEDMHLQMHMAKSSSFLCLEIK